jgi:alpha-mannosidase
VFSALKPAEEQPGFIVRCYNPTDGLLCGAWRLGSPIRGAERVRADERGAAPLPLEDGGRLVRFEARAGEIVTIRMH